jgi:DNA-binding NarL/FixJ family response regulator
VPFRAAIAADVPLVMASHALYPALDPNAIASQSRPILSELLRGELHFRGAIVTDSIEARAVIARSDVGTAAIRAVAAGGTYLDPAIAGLIVGRAEQSGIAGGSDCSAELSAREAEVLQLAAAGYTNKEVSTRLRVSVKTIETYKTRGMVKLGLDTRSELVRYALVKGWLTGP